MHTHIHTQVYIKNVHSLTKSLDLTFDIIILVIIYSYIIEDGHSFVFLYFINFLFRPFIHTDVTGDF